jgi:anti-sigma regulatory factor (Ser/Thr protein kinase)
MPSLTIKAPIRRGDIDGIREWLTSEADKAKLDKTACYQLFSVVDELSCNIMEHSGATWMEVDLLAGPEKATVILKDDGKPFDPIEASALPSEHYLASGPERRLGLWMVFKMVDKAFYERKEGKTNELTVQKLFQGSSGESPL